MPLLSLSRATRHECACVPETHGLRRDLLPGRGKREKVFPRRKGTCRSRRGAPVGRDLPSARRRVGLRLTKEPRVSTACGRCDRGKGKWEIRGKVPASVGARPQQLVSRPLGAGERYLAPVSVCSRTTLTGGPRGPARAAARAAAGSSPARGRMRAPAHRIRAHKPRPPAGPRASEVRPPCAFATGEPWRDVIRRLAGDVTDAKRSPAGVALRKFMLDTRMKE